MAYDESVRGDVTRDDRNLARRIAHGGAAYQPEGATPTTANGLAERYLEEVGTVLGLEPRPAVSRSADAVTYDVDDATGGVELVEERRGRDVTVVSYEQIHAGLPVFRAGVAVRVRNDLSGVVSSQSTLVSDIDVQVPADEAAAMADRSYGEMSNAELGRAIGKTSGRRPRVGSVRLVIYRYRADARLDPSAAEHDQPESSPSLDLPDVPDGIVEGGDYVARHVTFTFEHAGWGEIDWEALVEIVTGAVLYARSSVESCNGSIFADDPITISGNPAHDPCAPTAVLEPLTSQVTLQGLNPPVGGVQALSGEYVEIVDTDAPAIVPPTAPAGNCDFTFDPTTDDFSAVNAYFHMDALYRMVAEMGFVDYFAGTTFPIPVDHRGENGGVNAHHHGFGNATTKFRYGMAQAGCPVGMACDRRIVIHEFAHSVLRNRINSGTLAFAHGVGDTMAVIMSDPRSQADDPFDTFPFNAINRRHDRAVADGWGWGGAFDTGGYSSTQILATTLFRAYRSLGGEAADVTEREFAARWVSYLILAAVESATPLTQPQGPEDLAEDLIDADLNTVSFDGHPGGAFHKVIRWAFEEQNAFGGQPPDVDLYIDDTRSGEYAWLPHFTSPPGVWVRQEADGGLFHQHPVVETPAYVYARIENRGTRPARNVSVTAFSGPAGTDGRFPDDYVPLGPPEAVAGSIAPGESVVVGPFDWTPGDDPGASILLSVSNRNDPSNIELVQGPVPARRLVPYDNNLGQRAVSIKPYPYRYSAKFVCGAACGDETGQVAPGRYFTALNIHNPYNRPVWYRRRVAVALPGERAGHLTDFTFTKLDPYEAVEIDCPDIHDMLGLPGGCFLKGFVVIEAIVNLEVTGVYSAANGDGQVEALDVERIEPKTSWR